MQADEVGALAALKERRRDIAVQKNEERRKQIE
jgi:hypothetical protein